MKLSSSLATISAVLSVISALPTLTRRDFSPNTCQLQNFQQISLLSQVDIEVRADVFLVQGGDVQLGELGWSNSSGNPQPGQNEVYTAALVQASNPPVLTLQIPNVFESTVNITWDGSKLAPSINETAGFFIRCDSCLAPNSLIVGGNCQLEVVKDQKGTGQCVNFPGLNKHIETAACDNGDVKQRVDIISLFAILNSTTT